jgi:hypothetical protein
MDKSVHQARWLFAPVICLGLSFLVFGIVAV